MSKTKIKTYTLKFNELRVWNLVMGILHLVQGIIMITLSNGSTFLTKLYLPVPDVATRSASIVAEDFIEINLGYAIAAFLLLSAVAHFITILPRVHQWYLNNLKKEINLIRWWEYALSSSLMIVVVAALSFVDDASTLLLIFFSNAAMNLFGAMMEKNNSLLKQNAKLEKKINKEKAVEYKTDWSGYLYGIFAGLAPWIIVFTYFYATLDRVDSITPIPDFVKTIVPVLFISFNTFAINMFLQYKKIGPWKNYLFGEKMYIILSLVAKSILAWIIFGGTLR